MHNTTDLTTPSTSALALVEIDPATQVAVVTLNRPEARNAMNAELLADLDAAWDRVLDADDVGAVVLTGADPAFCAGMDLSVMAAGDPPAAITEPGRLTRSSTPVIGAVNGPAVTGGLEMVLPCDFLVASERAWFADTHAQLGFLPGPDLAVGLAAVVGPAVAAEISLTGRRVSAHEACALGLVNRVVPHEELLPTAVDLARQISACDRGAVRAIKATRRSSFEAVHAPAIALARDAYLEFVEGLRRSPAA